MRTPNCKKGSLLSSEINRLTSNFLKEIARKIRPMIERELIERICVRFGVTQPARALPLAKPKTKTRRAKPAVSKTVRKLLPPVKLVDRPAESFAPTKQSKVKLKPTETAPSKENNQFDPQARLNKIKALIRAKNKPEKKPAKPRLFQPRPKISAPVRLIVDQPVVQKPDPPEPGIVNQPVTPPDPPEQSSDLPPSLPDQENRADDELPDDGRAPQTSDPADNINRRHLDKIF